MQRWWPTAWSVGVLALALGCGAEPARPAAPAPAPASSRANAGVAPGASPYVTTLRSRLGPDAVLSLAPNLQQAAEKALLDAATPGAVVALDPNDGSVRALFSVPGDRGDPLVTPDVPASTFKVFTAIAALQAGVLTPDTQLACSGSYDFAGAHLTCPQAHGREDVRHALAVSCNVFFYQVGEQLEPARLAQVARDFGLASPSGSELAERPGVIPTPPAPGTAKTPRRLVQAIGHADYTVTLLELARAYAAIANGGSLNELHLVSARRSANGSVTPALHAPAARLPVEPAILELVRAGLTDGVAADYGRAHAVASEDYPFAGKSGGNDSPPRAGSAAGNVATEGEQDLWFVAYAPPVAPLLLVAARLERAHDNASAMQLVAQVLAATRAH